MFTNTFTAAWHCNRPRFKSRAFPTTAFRKLRLQLFGYIPFVLPCFGQHFRALPTRSSALTPSLLTPSLTHSLPRSLTPSLPDALPRSLTPSSLPPSRPLSPTPPLRASVARIPRSRSITARISPHHDAFRKGYPASSASV